MLSWCFWVNLSAIYCDGGRGLLGGCHGGRVADGGCSWLANVWITSASKRHLPLTFSRSFWLFYPSYMICSWLSCFLGKKTHFTISLQISLAQIIAYFNFWYLRWANWYFSKVRCKSLKYFEWFWFKLPSTAKILKDGKYGEFVQKSTWLKFCPIFWVLNLVQNFQRISYPASEIDSQKKVWKFQTLHEFQM